MKQRSRQSVKTVQPSVELKSKPVAAAAEISAKTVMVISAGNSPLHLPLAGKKVKNVRTSLKTALNIAPSANALVNGQKVDENYVLEGSETLEFVRFAGEKGKRPRGS